MAYPVLYLKGNEEPDAAENDQRGNHKLNEEIVLKTDQAVRKQRKTSVSKPGNGVKNRKPRGRSIESKRAVKVQ